MGFYRGPNIPRNNLSLALDAASPRSYPGSGADWFDLSPNKITMSSYGTQTPITTINGAKCFDFNGSGYWASDSGHENVDFAGDCTLLMWVYAEDLSERDTIFEKSGTSFNSYEQEIAVTYETGESFSWYSRRYDDYDYGSTTTMTIGAWNLMGIKMSTGKTTTARTGFWSKNGSSWSASYTSRSNTAIVPAGAVIIGSGYAGPVENGYIAMVYCYNKMLDDNEVLQFYNGTKSRFGL
jgi:hypothetical protein